MGQLLSRLVDFILVLINYVAITTWLTSIQHIAERALLGVGDGQPIVALDLNPGLGVRAKEVVAGWLPLIRPAVAFALVDAAGHSPQLRTHDIVGVVFALGGCPVCGSRLLQLY